jgi:hypothetical protein
MRDNLLVQLPGIAGILSELPHHIIGYEVPPFFQIAVLCSL